MGQRGRPRSPDLLTPREQDVLALLRDNLTNEQIAERLGISFETAKHHVGEILSKLGVSTREAAATWREEREWSVGRIALAIVGTAIVAAAVGGLALLAWGLSEAGTSETSPLPSLAGILPGPVYYLPPDDGSPQISTPDLINQAGITVVSTAEELKATDPGPMIAVIVDKEWWDSVGLEWLASTMASGVVLIGARVNIGGFSVYPEGRNFYTMRYGCTGPSQNSSGQAQDYLDFNNRAQFRLMLHRIADVAKGSECLPVAPSVSPSVATPTPTLGPDGLTAALEFSHLRDAINRPGYIFHTTLTEQGANGLIIDEWIDYGTDVARQTIRDETRSFEKQFIFKSAAQYAGPDDQSPADYQVCPSVGNVFVSLIVDCWREQPFNHPFVYRVDPTADYSGQPAVAVTIESLPPTPTPAGYRPGNLTLRLYLDRDTYLPLAKSTLIDWVYTNEFVAADTLPADFFDQSSLPALPPSASPPPGG